MEIQALKLACFSPTGTSKAIVQAVARGIDHEVTELLDVTKPDARAQQVKTAQGELLVVAVPVYGGRVPGLLRQWLQGIEAENTPVVCIVVYGNRDYEDALLELRNIMKERGAVPVACAAFIGEHSFSSPDTPIAVARPDEADLELAQAFGRKIRETVHAIASLEQVPEIEVPGNFPYKEGKAAPPVVFMTVDDSCVQCGVCAEACPVDAIDAEDHTVVDMEKCIRCCACIKSCPENARSMKPSPVKDIAIRVSTMCQERKEPVSFF